MPNVRPAHNQSVNDFTPIETEVLAQGILRAVTVSEGDLAGLLFAICIERDSSSNRISV